MNTAPEQIRAELADTEQSIEEISRRSHPEIVKMLEDLLAAHDRALDIVSGPKRAQLWENAIDLLAARAYQTATVAKDLCLRGYYGDAGILARVLIEQGLLIKYYSSHHEEAMEYLCGWDYEAILELVTSLIQALGTTVDPSVKDLLLKLRQEVELCNDPAAIVFWYKVKGKVKHPQQPVKLLKSQIQEEIEKGRTPGFQKLVKEVQDEQARVVYEAMNHFVHSRSLTAMMSTEVDKEPSGALTLAKGPKYHKGDFMYVAQPVYSAECKVLQAWTAAVPLLLKNEQWAESLAALVERVLNLQE